MKQFGWFFLIWLASVFFTRRYFDVNSLDTFLEE